MSKNCKHRGDRLSVRANGGKRIDVFACDKFGRCVEASADCVRTATPNSCEGCKAFEALIEIPAFYDCQHRGEPTGEKLNCHCGTDKLIYQCGVFGACVKRLPSGWSLDKFNTQNPGVAVCRGCGSAD